MRPKQKLLVLTPRFPYPVVGGDRLRIYFVCKHLAKKFDITLLSLCESREEMEFVVPNDGIFSRVERVLLPIFRSRLNCLAALFSGESLQVAYYHSAKFLARARELAADHDVILAHLVRTGPYVLNIDMRNKISVLEMTDAISMNYSRVKRLGQVAGLRNVIYSFEQRRLREVELALAGRFDLTVLVSEVDRQYLIDEANSLSEKIIVCSNGVDTNDIEYNYAPDGKTMVFIGNMTSLQNLDAVKWFVREIMPKVLIHGDYQLKIIGRIRDSDRNYFNNIKNVFATGEVNSVADAAQGATIGICSVRMAAGIQNKILECMALGVPVITTRIGYEGLAAIENEDVLVVNSAEEYVQSIISLFNSKELCESLSHRGRRYVESNHSWEAKLLTLENAIEQVSQKMNCNFRSRSG